MQRISECSYNSMEISPEGPLKIIMLFAQIENSTEMGEISALCEKSGVKIGGLP